MIDLDELVRQFFFAFKIIRRQCSRHTRDIFLFQLKRGGNKKVRVNTVDVRGAAFTQPWVIERCLESTLNAKTFGELMAGVQKANMMLQQLDIFAHVDVEMDTAAAIYGSEAVDVTFVVKVRIFFV